MAEFFDCPGKLHCPHGGAPKEEEHGHGEQEKRDVRYRPVPEEAHIPAMQSIAVSFGLMIMMRG